MALFSLANGSATLSGGGYSGTDIFTSALDGTFPMMISHVDLGLLASDDIDTIEVDVASVPTAGAALSM